MRKVIIFLTVIIIACVVLIGCTGNNATLLQDGEKLTVIDNTLGEGRENNINFVHTYENSTVTEGRGYVYILPVSESNPTVRYFTSVKQGNNGKLVEITSVKNGDALKESDFLEWSGYWEQGLQFVDGQSTDVHYSTVITKTIYRYKVSRNNNITVWGNKYLTVTVTSSVIGDEPLNFTVEIVNFFQLPMLLGHEGDSWEITVVED